ncbi:MAG: malto-oligosyltrehalose synthase [Nitrospira sp.]|nr:malto-oligosyltrehalose synthase [Nitrospira sp.]
MPSEISTYRLQFCCGFTLDEGAAITAYLAQLGISHVYSSPLLQAGKGSTHGYDVVDHSRVNEELGGEPAFERFSRALQTEGLGLLLDIVPNHMAIGRDNLWWWDVLENGQSSRYAPYFDVEWTPPESKLHHVIMLPVLADHYGRVLDKGDIHIERHEGTFTVHYHEHMFPIAPRSLQFILSPAASGAASEELGFLADALELLPSSHATDWVSLRRRHRDKGVLKGLLTKYLQENPRLATAVDGAIEELNRDPQSLHELLERQNYRLAFWRTATRDLGYRRFFDVNTLIGLRTEDERVFADIHQRLFQWLGPDGPVDGVRVDHPDGLLDPQQYLARLREHVPSRWIVVEKILMPDEQLPADWPVSGTTGYDFMNQVMGLFIAQEGEEPLTHFYADFAGVESIFADILRDKKRQVLREVLGSDLNILTSMLVNICERHPHHRDYTRHDLHEALRELLVNFPVYRTYVRPHLGSVAQGDERVLSLALQAVETHRPDLASDLFGFIRDILLLTVKGDLESDFVARFQQITGPVMAKGAEDTAFYCYHRFIALNEVGGDPGRFGITVEQFHAWCRNMQRHWPKTLLGTSTHDTKRSEDVRARLVVLSEIPAQWAEQVTAWSKRHIHYWRTSPPDHNFEYFWYQTMVGAWPLEQDRAIPYCEKAMREAKMHTSWTDPHEDYEDNITSFVASLYTDETFLQELRGFVESLQQYGQLTSLAQTLIKLTAPGIPDLYQGTELWNFSLVDPDNRRPVDFDQRRRWLHELTGMSPDEVWDRRHEGLPKLWLIRQGLRVRQERPQSFGSEGGYSPLYARGEKSRHVVSFLRGEDVIVVATRLSLSLNNAWGDCVIDLPEGRWRQELTGQTFGGGVCRLDDLLSPFFQALLCKIG